MPKIREPIKKFGGAIKDRLTRKQVPVPGEQRDVQEFGDDSGNPVRKIPLRRNEIDLGPLSGRKDRNGILRNPNYHPSDDTDKKPKKRRTSDGYMRIN